MPGALPAFHDAVVALAAGLDAEGVRGVQWRTLGGAKGGRQQQGEGAEEADGAQNRRGHDQER